MHPGMPECYFCRHFYRNKGRVCRAFPQGIPEDIFHGRKLHRKPIDGDNGFQFELDPDEEEMAELHNVKK
jgi:hypothetical protein